MLRTSTGRKCTSNTARLCCFIARRPRRWATLEQRRSRRRHRRDRRRNGDDSRSAADRMSDSEATSTRTSCSRSSAKMKTAIAEHYDVSAVADPATGRRDRRRAVRAGRPAPRSAQSQAAPARLILSSVDARFAELCGPVLAVASRAARHASDQLALDFLQQLCKCSVTLVYKLSLLARIVSCCSANAFFNRYFRLGKFQSLGTTRCVVLCGTEKWSASRDNRWAKRPLGNGAKRLAGRRDAATKK